MKDQKKGGKGPTYNKEKESSPTLPSEINEGQKQNRMNQDSKEYASGKNADNIHEDDTPTN